MPLTGRRHKLLVVEDDKIIGKNIQNALSEEGYQVDLIQDGLMASKQLESANYDALILDIKLPGRSGFEICRDFREKDSLTPILLLTAYDELEDKVEGYESGADDYLTKPFYLKELSLRIATLIKKREQITQPASNLTPKTHLLRYQNLELDLDQKKVLRKGEFIRLTPREFQILSTLIEAKGAPVSKRDLVKKIWGSSFDHNTNTIEVYINFLRNKIDKPYGSRLIKTRVGYGYYLEEESDHAD